LYSIIIPIHNEGKVLHKLLESLKHLLKKNHEIIIIDDGSTDNSAKILLKYPLIKTIKFSKNCGKGAALRVGLQQAKHNKIIIFDGDMELDPNDIDKLMILDEVNNVECVFGSRFDSIYPFSSIWNFGNYFFTLFFNIVNGSSLDDSLCCAKAFYKKDINQEKLKSKKFDIDVELASQLLKNKKSIISVKINYERRSTFDGKKLNVFNSLSIILRILKGL